MHNSYEKLAKIGASRLQVYNKKTFLSVGCDLQSKKKLLWFLQTRNNTYENDGIVFRNSFLWDFLEDDINSSFKKASEVERRIVTASFLHKIIYDILL